MDLEKDMSDDAIVIALLADKSIATQFYSALCNMRWVKRSILPEDEEIVRILKEGKVSDYWCCSWRSSGGIIADIRNRHYNVKEDYMDYYCAGDEGHVSDLVLECFDRMGWEPLPYPDVD